MKDCPFCLENNALRGDIIAESGAAFAIHPYDAPECFLIIPKLHADTLDVLPDEWWVEFKAVLAQLPDLPEQYNVSLNFGAAAGQTVKHLHFWLIPRKEHEPGAGKGLVTLLGAYNQAHANQHEQ